MWQQAGGEGLLGVVRQVTRRLTCLILLGSHGSHSSLLHRMGSHRAVEVRWDLGRWHGQGQPEQVAWVVPKVVSILRPGCCRAAGSGVCEIQLMGKKTFPSSVSLDISGCGHVACLMFPFVELGQSCICLFLRSSGVAAQLLLPHVLCQRAEGVCGPFRCDRSA